MSLGCSLLSPKERYSAKHGHSHHKSGSEHATRLDKSKFNCVPTSRTYQTFPVWKPPHRGFKWLWLIALGLTLLSLFHPNWKAMEDWYWSVLFICYNWSSWISKPWIRTVQSSTGQGNCPFSPCLHHGIGKIPLWWALGSSELLLCGPKRSHRHHVGPCRNYKLSGPSPIQSHPAKEKQRLERVCSRKSISGMLAGVGDMPGCLIQWGLLAIKVQETSWSTGDH